MKANIPLNKEFNHERHNILGNNIRIFTSLSLQVTLFLFFFSFFFLFFFVWFCLVFSIKSDFFMFFIYFKLISFHSAITFCYNLSIFDVCIKMFTLVRFYTSFNRWPFTRAWVTGILLKSTGHFWVFLLTLILLWSVLGRF